MGSLYRVRQFLFALAAAPSAEDMEQIAQLLSPDQVMLFQCMQRSEQAHSIRIYRQLCEQGEANRDLLVAALLHDVGKSCHPLRLWERVEIVFVKWLAPDKIREWGCAEPSGWKRPFVVAEQHAVWGAQMAAQVGSTPLVVALIHQHQNAYQPNMQFVGKSASQYEALLRRLQLLDNQN